MVFYNIIKVVYDMKRSKKYNIIIYTSLILAIILLALGGKDYLKEQKTGNKVQTENQSSETGETIERTDNGEKAEEPEELKNVDIEGVIKKYLDSILDQIQKDKTITYNMIKTWGDYSISEIEYRREITAKYYEYKVNIMIPNKDAKIPGKKNEKLSTDEFIVISLFFDIADSQRVNGFIVKNIDKIEG